MRPLTVSISLVLYRPDLTVVEKTLSALSSAALYARKQGAVTFNTTLVDNSANQVSSEKIAEWFRAVSLTFDILKLQLICAPQNLGYGAGNNLVIGSAKSDYHIVINPDFLLEENALEECFSFMERHPSVGLLTPAIHGLDGERHYLCKRTPTLWIMFLRSFAPKWLRKVFKAQLDTFEMRDCDYAAMIYPVEYPTGCFMFFRTENLQAIGGFDERIFLHYEDADIGRRILALANTVYVPSVRGTHLWARETHKSWQARWLTLRSGFYYLRKWGGVWRAPRLDIPLFSSSNIPSSNLRRIYPHIGEGQRVMVTGANGFIGREMCAALAERGYQTLGITRARKHSFPTEMHLELESIDENTNWMPALAGIDCVVHLIAKVHELGPQPADAYGEYQRVNVALTINLARQAAAAGVRRFIFISSIKVNGEQSPLGQPFTAESTPRPEDYYGKSKLEAETALLQLGCETGMEITIIRPPLVYGPSAKANFASLIRCLARGWPLPLGAVVDNRRSFIALDNLVDFVATCIAHPAATNQVFLVSDGQDVSTATLVRKMASTLGRPARLVPVPISLLRLGASLIGRPQMYPRLCGSLQLEMSTACTLLDWQPPISLDEGLRRAGKGFLL